MCTGSEVQSAESKAGKSDWHPAGVPRGCKPLIPSSVKFEILRAGNVRKQRRLKYAASR